MSSLSREAVFAKLREILVFADSRYEAVADKCTEATRVREDLGLNSAGMLYVLIAMEETFGAIFDDVTVNAFTTIGDLIDWITERAK